MNSRLPPWVRGWLVGKWFGLHWDLWQVGAGLGVTKRIVVEMGRRKKEVAGKNHYTIKHQGNNWVKIGEASPPQPRNSRFFLMIIILRLGHFVFECGAAELIQKLFAVCQDLLKKFFCLCLPSGTLPWRHRWPRAKALPGHLQNTLSVCVHFAAPEVERQCLDHCEFIAPLVSWGHCYKSIVVLVKLSE